MTDLQQMGADCQPSETLGTTAILRGSVPARRIAGYAKEVAAYTKGNGRLQCVQKGYAPCSDPQSVITEIGYDCDRDLENTADSVFCAHGSGFTVKWDQVENYMHLPLQKSRKSTGTFCTATAAAPMVKLPATSFSEDEELMRIFERIYGKIGRNERYALHTPKEQDPDVQKTKQTAINAVPQEEYLLVDGYNLIFAWDELKALAQKSLDTARAKLEHILENYNGYRQCHLILVFDAYRVKGQHCEVEQHGNLQVVYTKEAETADSYIEKTSHRLAKTYRVRVATSDGMEQLIILGGGALRISAEEFRQEVLQTSAKIRGFLLEMEMHSQKKTIEKK